MQRWISSILLALVASFFSAVAAAIPNVDLLIKNYPTGSDAEVKAAIGGHVNSGAVKNTNAIRMSRAFNLSGAPIPAGPGANVAGLHTFRGGDKLNYAYNVNELKSWMVAKYGQPTMQFKAGPYGKAPQALAGRKGIIVFVDTGRSDNSDHIDLWDGQRVVGKGMFELAKQVYLWESRPPKVQSNQGEFVMTTNVRAEPSTSAQILGQRPRGTVVTILGSTGNFYRIGDGQFVPKASVKLLP